MRVPGSHEREQCHRCRRDLVFPRSTIGIGTTQTPATIGQLLSLQPREPERDRFLGFFVAASHLKQSLLGQAGSSAEH